MRSHTAMLVAATLLVPAAAAALPAQQHTFAGDDVWAERARQDLLAAHEIFAADHPGMHDPANPTFPILLERALEAALEVAERAASHADYAEALNKYSETLADGHALVFALPEDGADGGSSQLYWPGFVAAWRGDLLVHSNSESTPVPVGSTVLGCDGLEVPDLLRTRLRPYGFRASEPGQYWFRGPWAFAEQKASLHRAPRTCRFRTPDGDVRDMPLTWTPAPEDFVRSLIDASDGEHTPIGLSEPRPGIFLIGMPTFSPGERAVEAYRQLYAVLAERRQELATARAVAIDLRHNNGGSSQWSLDAARLLWGKDAVDERMNRYRAGVRILWRASPENIAHAFQLAAHVRESGRTKWAERLETLGSEMRAALAAGEPLVEEPSTRGTAYVGPPPASDFTTLVYVITPGRCASACLDALDVFTRFENVTLIGAPTSADSNYMEIRIADLPSGRGRIVVPTKMWQGRARASGEVYHPDILMDDLDWSTDAFLERIEREIR